MGGGRQCERNSQKHHPAVKTSAQTAAAAAAAVPAGMDEGGGGEEVAVVPFMWSAGDPLTGMACHKTTGSNRMLSPTAV